MRGQSEDGFSFRFVEFELTMGHLDGTDCQLETWNLEMDRSSEGWSCSFGVISAEVLLKSFPTWAKLKIK